MFIKDREVHLRDYLRIVGKRRRTAITFFLAVFGLVAVLTLTATPQYEGTTKILIEKVEPSNLSGRWSPGGYDPAFYQTQLQLIRSRSVARRVVETLSLAENNAIFGPDKARDRRLLGEIKSAASGWLNRIGIGSGKKGPERPREEVLAEEISKNIQVRPVPDSQIVRISFLSPNPELAALIAGTTAKAYIEEILELKMGSNRRTLEWMTRKAEEEGQKLQKAEQALQQYMRVNNLVTVDNRIAGTPEEMAELSTQLVRAESNRKQLEELNTRIRKLTSRQAPETLAVIASDQALQALRAQIVMAEKNVMELSARYGPKHPVMEKAQSDLRLLQSKRQQEVNRIIESVRNDYELALSNERNLRAQLDRLKSEALRVNDKFVQYGVLKREVDTNRQLFDSLLLKIKEQTITEENNPINLWIVEEAGIPLSPAKPTTGLNLLLGLVLGLFGGVALAFFREYLDNTIKLPAEAEALLAAPVLGVVTHCKGKNAIDGIVQREPLSSHAESYKALRTSLLLSAADKAPGKILITSAISGEGKTTTAINLAMALAQAEKRVVLIDADLRKPRLHGHFKLGNATGLSTYLAGASGKDILRKGPLANLAVLTSGPIPPNPSELLNSARMKELLDSLSEQYDVIICDSPPVLPVADARILARVFDGTVLVTQAGKTTYEQAARALKALRDVNRPVLGLVINALPLQKSDYYYAEYYASYRGAAN